MTTSSRFRTTTIAIAVTLFCILAPAQSSFTWNGGGGDNNWTTGGNWGGTAPATPQNILNFAGSTRLTPNNNFTAGSSGYQVLFNSGAGTFTLSGNSLTFMDNGATASKIENDSANGQTFNLPIVLGNNTGGGLQINAATAALTFGGTINLSTFGLNVNGANITTFNSSAVISGSGAVVKSGVGSATLAAANTYSGGTTISGGILKISADNNLGGSAGAITFNGGTLNATADLATSRTINFTGGGTLQANAGTTLTLNNGFNNNAAAGAAAVTVAGGTVSVKGNVAIANKNTLTLGGGTLEIDPGASGTFNSGGKMDIASGGVTGVINFRSGTATFNAADFFVIGDNSSAANGTVNILGGTMNIALLSGNRAMIGLQGSGNLNVSAGALNFGSAMGNIQLGGDIQYSVNNASGTMTISGSAAVTVSGSGTFELGRNASGKSGASGRLNLYGGTLSNSRNITKADGSGTVYFSGGTLKPTAASATFLNGLTLVVSTNGAVIDDSGNAMTIASALTHDSGLTGTDGGLVKKGAGTLTLSGANTYNGGSYLTAGTLTVTADNNLGAATGPVVIGSGTLRSSAPFATGRSVLLTNNSTLAVATGNTLTLNNGFSSSTPSGTTINVNAGGTLAIKGNVTITNDSPLQVNSATMDIDPGATGTYNATNKVLLANASASTAVMNIRSGTANFAAPDFFALGDSAATANGTLNVLGGTMNLLLGVNQRVLIGSAGTGAINVSGGTLNIGAAPNIIEVGGDIQFSGNNASGSITVNSGTLNVAGSGTFELGRNGPSKSGANGRINLYGGTLSSSRDITKADGTGMLVFSGGTLKAAANSATFLNGLTSVTVSTNGAILDDGAFMVTIGQPLLHDASLTTDGGLTKNGAGTLTLTGVNTFNGNTAVTGGNLLVNGTNASPVVTIQSGATMGGTGTIGGVVTVQSGGTLSPGSIATLTLSNAPVLQGTTALLLDKSAAPQNSARLALGSGAFTFAGALSVNNIGPALSGGESFTLFNASGYSGTFSSITLPSLPVQTPALNWYLGNLSVDGSIRVNRAPTAATASYSRGSAMGLKIRIADHLAAYTSDADGNAVSLDSVGTPSAGGSVSRDGTWIFYTPPGNDSDESFTYSVSDAFGGTTTGTINVTVVKQGGQVQSIAANSGSVTLTFAGIPGFGYDIQRDTNPSFTSPVVIYTTNAPVAGVFMIEDSQPPQAAAFYRMVER